MLSGGLEEEDAYTSFWVMLTIYSLKKIEALLIACKEICLEVGLVRECKTESKYRNWSKYFKCMANFKYCKWY